MQHDQFQLHADIEDRHWWFVGRRRILCRLVAEALAPSPQTTIIDVGCGTGANIAALADRYRCVGIDTSAEAIELACRRFPAAFVVPPSGGGCPGASEPPKGGTTNKSRSPQVRFIVGRAPDGLGDLAREARLVLLSDVLEHVVDDRAMLAELVATASPGCYFLVTVPADPSLWSQHDESFGHYRRYQRTQLEEVWAGLPVRPLLVSYFNARLLPLIRAVRAWTQRRGRAAGQVGTDFWLPNRPLNAILTKIFAGEAERLLATMHGQKPAYRSGSSLLALLRRE